MDNRTRNKRLIPFISLVTCAVLYALCFEIYFFEIKGFNIGKKNSGRKIKLLLLSDLHFKKFLDPSYKKLAKRINEIFPDLILIAGDVIDEDGMYAPAAEFFKLVERCIPKVAIMGNHDHKNRVRLDTYKRLYDQNNCCLLMNESKCFSFGGEQIVITGVDDFIEGNPSFERAVEFVGKEKNHLLLIHSPLQQEVIIREMMEINRQRPEDRRLNIQYILAGHNHGGQVCLFGFAPKMPEFAGKYLKGWYNRTFPFLYLSKGFGTSTLPFRIGARSEITIFYLGV